MKKVLFTMVTAIVLAASMTGSSTWAGKSDGTGKSGADGRPLWNGKDFDDFEFFFWSGTDNKGTFTAKDGIMVCSGKPAGYMYTKKSYSNYNLSFDLKFFKHGNSGILVHVGQKKALGIWPQSIEVQGMHKDMGQIIPIPRKLKLKSTEDKGARAKALKPLGEWNHMEIDVNGGNLVIKLNGTVVSTVKDCEITEGPIGFQSEGTMTHWRNIRILER